MRFQPLGDTSPSSWNEGFMANKIPESLQVEEPGPIEDGDAGLGSQDAEDLYYIKCLQKVWDYENARFAPVQNRIDAAWELYHMNYIKEKDLNQSDLKYPNAMIFTERTAAILMRMIDQTSNWYKMEAFFPQQQVIYNLLRRFVSQLIENQDNNFWSMLEEAFKSGIITGQIRMQILPEQDGTPMRSEDFGSSFALTNMASNFASEIDEDRPKLANQLLPRINIKNVPAETVLLDSSGNSRYVMWSMDVPTGQVFAEADARDYDKEKLRRARKVGPTMKNHLGNSERTREGLGPNTSNNSSMMRLTFFEGTLPDLENGVIVFKKKMMVVANSSEVIYGPADIPFWDEKFSMITAAFIKPPHAVYGKGLISENIDGFHSKEDMMNLLYDYLKRVLNPPYEVEEESLEDDSLRGQQSIIFPNRIYRVRLSGGKPVIRPISPGEVPTSTWNVVQAAEAMHQDATGTTNGVGGSVRARGRQTALEFNRRESEAGSMWYNIFKNLERGVMAPALRLIFLRAMQFFSDEMWSSYVKASIAALLEPVAKDQEMAKQWEEELNKVAAWDAKTRYENLGGFFNFKVRVFSALAERQAEIEKATFMLRSLAPIPGALQSLRLPRVVAKMVESFGWDMEEMLQPEVIGKLQANTPSIFPQPSGMVDDGGMDIPDLSGGGMSELNNMGSSLQPPTEGMFPGGPVNAAPNPPQLPGM